MELCGINVPYRMDGKSFAPLLSGKPPVRWKNVAYSYYRNGISVRTKRYRLTRYDRDEQPIVDLYDHRKDPYGHHNIAGDRPKTVQRLMPLLEKGNTGLYGGQPK